MPKPEVTFLKWCLLTLIGFLSFVVPREQVPGRSVNAVFLIDSTRGFGNDSFSIARNAIFGVLQYLPPDSDFTISAVGETSKLLFDSNNPGTSNLSWVQLPFQILGDHMSATTLIEQIKKHTSNDNKIRENAEIVVIVTNGGIEGLNLTLMNSIHKKKLIIVIIGDQPHNSLWEQLAADRSHVLHLRERSELDMLLTNISQLIRKDSYFPGDTDMFRIPNRHSLSSCSILPPCVSSYQRQVCQCPFYIRPEDFHLEIAPAKKNQNKIHTPEIVIAATVCSVLVLIIIIVVLLLCLCLKQKKSGLNKKIDDKLGVQVAAEQEHFLEQREEEVNIINENAGAGAGANDIETDEAALMRKTELALAEPMELVHSTNGAIESNMATASNVEAHV